MFDFKSSMAARGMKLQSYRTSQIRPRHVYLQNLQLMVTMSQLAPWLQSGKFKLL